MNPHSGLVESIRQRCLSINLANFHQYIEQDVQFFALDAFARVQATEGSIWLADTAEQALVIAYNTGPKAAELEGTVKQPLSSGVVSMVYATEQGFIEDDTTNSPQHSKDVDQALEQKTLAMMAVPFYFGDALRGVMSCVKLSNDSQVTQHVFTMQDLQCLNNLASVFGKMIEHSLIRSTVQES